MKIVVTARSLNSAPHIGDFCGTYRYLADKILIADGGSSDGSQGSMDHFEKVDIRPFTERVNRASGAWRNPHGKHINFLLDWAFDGEQADWVIFDDIDCHPNYKLRKEARSFFRLAEERGDLAIFAYRLHILGGDRYFPRMNDAGQSIWAFSKHSKVRASEVDPWKHHINGIPSREESLYLEHPFILMHHSWPSEASIAEKQKRYQAIYQTPYPHPTQSYGPLEPLPDYARIEE